MATHCQLQSTAKGRAVQRRDDGLFDVLKQLNDIAEERLLRCFTELGDVGTGAECPARAGQHDGFDRRVQCRCLHHRDDAVAHRIAKRIDRRAVDPDDRHSAVALGGNRRGGGR